MGFSIASPHSEQKIGSGCRRRCSSGPEAVGAEATGAIPGEGPPPLDEGDEGVVAGVVDTLAPKLRSAPPTDPRFIWQAAARASAAPPTPRGCRNWRGRRGSGFEGTDTMHRETPSLGSAAAGRASA